MKKNYAYTVSDEYFQELKQNNILSNEVMWNKGSRPYFFIVKIEKDLAWLSPLSSKVNDSKVKKYPNQFERCEYRGLPGVIRIEKSIPIPFKYLQKRVETIAANQQTAKDKLNKIIASKKYQLNTYGNVRGLDSLKILNHYQKQSSFNQAQTRTVSIDNASANDRTTEFKNFDQMIEKLNGQKKGNYHVVDCPCCNEHEAYVYDNNINVIKCSRLNECGETTVISYNEKQVKRIRSQVDKKASDRKQLYSTFNLMLDKDSEYEQTMKVAEYRGLEGDEAVDIYNLDNIKLLAGVDTEGLNKLLLKQGGNFASDFHKRNIVHTLRNDSGEIERVLLRSDKESLDIKEKQIKLVEDATSMFKHNLSSDTIVIAESQLDGLSLIKDNQELGLIGLTGVNRTKELFRYLEENYKEMLDKQFIVAMDNDKAGVGTSHEIALKLEEMGLTHVIYTYNTDVKDLNDYLNQNPQMMKEGLKQALNDLEGMKLSAKDKEVRNMSKYVSQILTNVSTNPTSMNKLMDNILVNPELSIENHALLMSQKIDSKNISSEYMLKKEGIEPDGDIKTEKGLYCFRQKGYFEQNKYVPLKPGEYKQDTKIYTKFKWYTKDNLYQNKDVGIPERIFDNVVLEVDDQLKVLNEYAKETGISINASNMQNDVHVNNARLSITLNKNLSKQQMVDHLIPNISELKSKQYYSNPKVATVCSKQLSCMLASKIGKSPVVDNKCNSRILATEVKYISKFLVHQSKELNTITNRQLNRTIAHSHESGYDR